MKDFLFLTCLSLKDLRNRVQQSSAQQTTIFALHSRNRHRHTHTHIRRVCFRWKRKILIEDNFIFTNALSLARELHSILFYSSFPNNLHIDVIENKWTNTEIQDITSELMILIFNQSTHTYTHTDRDHQVETKSDLRVKSISRRSIVAWMRDVPIVHISLFFLDLGHSCTGMDSFSPIDAIESNRRNRKKDRLFVFFMSNRELLVSNSSLEKSYSKFVNIIFLSMKFFFQSKSTICRRANFDSTHLIDSFLFDKIESFVMDRRWWLGEGEDLSE